MHLREYTRAIKRELPSEAFQPVPQRALWMIPHLAVIIGGISAIALWISSGWLKLLVGLVIGHSFACLGFLAHEILHGAVTKKPWLRNTLGLICFLPFSLGPRLWRKWHNVEHHAHTQNDEDDPDAMGTLESLRERPFLRAFYRVVPWLRSLFTFLSFTFWFTFHGMNMFFRFLPEFKRSERPMVIAQFVGPLLFWAALLYVLGPVNGVFAVVIPMLAANFIVMSYIATNHLLNPLTEINDPLANSLSVQVPRIVDMLHFNFSHHTEHHVFPAMNAKYLPLVKQQLKQQWPDRYNEMPHWKALRTLWKTPRLYRDAEASPLIDPVRDYTFPTLGRGLDPDRVVPERGLLAGMNAENTRAPEAQEASASPSGTGVERLPKGAPYPKPFKPGESGAKL